MLSAEVPGATLCPLTAQTWSRQQDVGEERSGSSPLATGHSWTGTQHAQPLGLASEALAAVDSATTQQAAGAERAAPRASIFDDRHCMRVMDDKSVL